MGEQEQKRADVEVLSRLLVFAVEVVLESGARPSIADHLLDALREIEDGAFDA